MQAFLVTFFYPRTAGAIRTAAVTCLQALFQSNFLLENHIGKLLPELQPKVILLEIASCKYAVFF